MKNILPLEHFQTKEKAKLIMNMTATAGLFVSSKVFETLFYSIPTIDVSYHFFGGFLISQGIDLLTIKKMQTRWILEKVALVGIIWEIWEYLSGSPGTGFTYDSTKDLIMDMLGAYAYLHLSKPDDIYTQGNRPVKF